jgi:hypothetical protein
MEFFIFSAIIGGIFAAISYNIATAKNRDAGVWAIVTIIFPLSLLVLLSLPALADDK